MQSHTRTAVTMLVLVAILSAAGWYGWQGLTAEPDVEARPEAEPTAVCTTPGPVTARARRVLVSVYNAGAPAGTGGLVMDALTRRGFRRGEIEVAPRGAAVNGTVIWTPDPADPAVQLVGRQLRGAKVREYADPPGPGVNILFGQEFTGLRKAPRELTVQPEPSCS